MFPEYSIGVRVRFFESDAIIKEIGKFGGWLQALGFVVIIGIIFEIVAFLMNRRGFKEINKIKQDM